MASIRCSDLGLGLWLMLTCLGSLGRLQVGLPFRACYLSSKTLALLYWSHERGRTPESVEDSLEAFPAVKREQVIAVIEAGKLKMLETV